MGQLLLPDNIPNIVVASTTSVTLASTNNGQATTITVGGQQYSLSSTLTLATGTTGANGLDTGSLGVIQLWYVYVIVNSSTFAPALIASQAGPSTGPSIPVGYFSAYKLAGAFYTNGSSQVGSVVSGIYTQATTGWMSFTPSWTSSGTAPSIGNGSVTGFFRRNGDVQEVRIQLLTGSTTTYGSGNYFLSLPFTMNTASLPSTDQILGHGVAISTTTNFLIEAILQSTTTVTMFSNATGTNVGATSPFTFAAGEAIELSISAPVSGWNATLL